MNFATIMRALAIGEATKRPTWMGYCKKIAASTNQKMSDGVTEVSYQIVFKQRDGDTFTYRVDASGNIEYVGAVQSVTGDANNTTSYPTNGDSATVVLNFDSQLLAAMLSSDWVSGSPEDFEAAASSSGNIW